MTKAATYTAKPCKNCGGVIRYVSNGNCPICQHEAQRRYRARKTGVEPRRRKSRRRAAPIQQKPATGPYREPTGLASFLFKIFTSPLNIFRSSCKWIAA